MKLSSTLKIRSTKEALWPYYADVKNWSHWEDDLESISIEGDFSTNVKGIMKLADMPALDFVLTEVVPFKSFWDATQTPMGTLYFGHDIVEEGEDIIITHTVQCDNAEASLDTIGFLQKIFMDVPQSMYKLKQILEK